MPSFTHKPEYRLLVDLMRGARLRAGYTQAQVAEAWGTTQSVVSKIERGERRLDLVQFIEYCDLLGLSPEEEFGRFLTALRT